MKETILAFCIEVHSKSSQTSTKNIWTGVQKEKRKTVQTPLPFRPRELALGPCELDVAKKLAQTPSVDPLQRKTEEAGASTAYSSQERETHVALPFFGETPPPKKRTKKHGCLPLGFPRKKDTETRYPTKSHTEPKTGNMPP